MVTVVNLAHEDDPSPHKPRSSLYTLHALTGRRHVAGKAKSRSQNLQVLLGHLTPLFQVVISSIVTPDVKSTVLISMSVCQQSL